MTDNLCTERFFYYFKELSKIPRGSGNMKAVSNYCEDFAKSHGLEYIKDDACNIVIFKPASVGFEKSKPVILQGHLDMVCQKTEECEIDFEKDGIEIYEDGDFLKAKGTTLGADNGIAVAMILAVLEDEKLLHPAIEAVFTVDEEVGMLGALKLDMSVLKADKMINLDSEEEGVITVSCAGGGDLCAVLPFENTKKQGTEITLTLKGLKGGHSGVEINSGRINADMLAGRILDAVGKKCDFDIISINGGDKSNAIPNKCTAKVCAYDAEEFCKYAKEYLEVVKDEIAFREKEFCFDIAKGESGEFNAVDENSAKKLLYALVCSPCGVVEMSAEIEGLVETSLNLGVLKTEKNRIFLQFSLRSNKSSALGFLTRRLEVFFSALNFECETSGYYPPWEFKDNSALQSIYSNVYEEFTGQKPEIAAIHAGLECGVFSSALKGIECISVGPEMFDVHTTNEKLCISSAKRLFEILKKVLEKL